MNRILLAAVFTSSACSFGGGGIDVGTEGSATGLGGSTTATPDTSAADANGTESGEPSVQESTGEADTGPPPAGCGNRVVEDDEACDDGNDNEVDGCTSACAEGPLGVAFGPMEVTDDEFSGWASPNFSEISDCPRDSVLIGIRGEFSTYFGFDVLGQARGICAPIALINAAPTAIGFGDEMELPLFGQKTGEAFELLCPPNAAMTGFFGTASMYIESVGITCRSLAVTARQDAVVIGPPTSAGPFGGGNDEDLMCPDSTTATGLVVEGDEYASTFKLRCRALTLTLPR